jgi:hypothetical protein
VWPDVGGTQYIPVWGFVTPFHGGVVQLLPHLSLARLLFTLINYLLGGKLIVPAVKITDKQHANGTDWQEV